MSWSWIDIILFTLVVLCIVWVGHHIRNPTHRLSWSILLQQPMAVSAGIIWLFFLGIALLDSTPWPGQVEQPKTALDAIFAPLDTFYEKTYSEPLALRAFVEETEVVQGKVARFHAPLSYPPLALQATDSKQTFIAHALLRAGLWALLGMAGMAFFWMIVHARTTHLSTAAWAGILTLGVLIFLSLAAYAISRELHVLGTGKIGQDIFYYAVKSIRTALVIGLFTTLLTLPFALAFGVWAGYFGGWVDDVIQYIYTTVSSVPAVLLITASVLSMQIFIATHSQYFTTLHAAADARLFSLCAILGLTSWTNLCRLVRGETLKLRQMEYVLAGKVLGSSTFFIFRKHILPNAMHVVLMTVVLDFSSLVLAEAVLTYVGVGVSPMTMSWGNMINSARLELARDPIVWWPMLSAFMFMVTLVFACNWFADAFQEAFHPKLRERLIYTHSN
ncbi:MAG: ABC transporter permease [Legionellaceae bacterium]|nr:ABC transporter permease [Legionellaceae bacterium]